MSERTPATTPTLYIDCTETLMTGLNTGIQRIVRNLVSRAPQMSAALGVECVPVFAKGGQLWVLNDPNALARSGRSGRMKQARDRFVRVEAAFQGMVRQRLSRSPILQRLTLGTWNLPRRALKQAARMVTRGRAAKGQHITPAQPGRGDVLLMPDAFWTSDIVAVLEGGAANGALIVPVIADIIPLTHPQFFSGTMPQEFESALRRLLALSGGALAISEATREETRRWLSKQPKGPGADFPIEVAYCGADVVAPQVVDDSAIRPESKALAGSEYYLMVGTLEPRKGQLAVLDAFEAMWRQGETAKLVLVGRIGWGFAEVVQRLKDSPFAGSHLVALHDATDGEVDWLYRHARAVILASHVEGFGLPLVEAMHHGIPVLASDIPVFREIGGDYPVYFSLEQPGALGAALAALRNRIASGRQPPPQKWVTWDEAAPDYFRKALALRDRVRGTGR